jgi:Undecaprenyl-phosphate galactose phosphotransferase WbaP
MNSESHTNKSGGTTPPTQHSELITQAPCRRSLAILIVLALIALGLMVIPHSTLYYPNVVVDTTGGIQMDFLLFGQQDKAACENSLASITNAITTSCRECSTRSQTCINNPTAEMQQRFGETPLLVPSARMANGVITYAAPKMDIALLACQESERQASLNGNQSKVACYPAGSMRPHTSFEKQQSKTSHTIFTLLLALCGCLIASLVAAILITYFRNSSLSIEQSAHKSYPLLEKFTLASVDTLILLGTFLAISWPESGDINRWSQLDRATVISYGVIILITIGWFWLLLEHYARRRPFWDELREIYRVLTVMFMVSSASAFLVGSQSGRSTHLIVWALNFLLIPLARAFFKGLLDDIGLWKRPAIIIGTGENARDAYLAIKSERGMGYRVLGFVKVCANDPEDRESLTLNTETFPILDYSASLENLHTTFGKAQVIIALDSLADEGSQTYVRRILANFTNVHIIPSIRGLPLFGTQLSHFFSHEVLFLTVRNNLSRRSVQWIKRTFDFVAASILLVILSPLMAYVAWRIWREDGGPVIFHQPRLARNKGEFGFLKFRSMVKNADQIIAHWREINSPEWQEYYANNFKLKNDPRVLGVGSWIRATSIDELPQLINVLRGEMSLVGPRPLLARELPEYGESINYYRQARPGITGLWQISGRSGTKFHDRARLDEWYVQNWSLWYDIAILFKTVDIVFNRRGAY